MELALGYSWPGNVRQLANVLERAAILAPGERLSAEQIGRLLGRKAAAGGAGDEGAADGGAGTPAAPAAPASPASPASDTELERLRAALRDAGGDKRLAATALGMSYRTLLRRIEEHDLKGYPRYRD